MGHGFDEFVELIAALRAPDGCPWDREQTHRSIAKNMVEEAYEAVHAIETDDVAEIREELGDVLLQVVLQAQIAADVVTTWDGIKAVERAEKSQGLLDSVPHAQPALMQAQGISRKAV